MPGVAALNVSNIDKPVGAGVTMAVASGNGLLHDANKPPAIIIAEADLKNWYMGNFILFQLSITVFIKR